MTEHHDEQRPEGLRRDAAPLPRQDGALQTEADAAPLPPRFADAEMLPNDPKGLEKWLDRLLSVQRPLVVKQIKGLRSRYPDATPAELAKMIERQYLNAVTISGGAAGAAAAVPGVGTLASAGVTGVEVAGFLEMTALYGQSMAELHGLHTNDPVRARTLVMGLMLGDHGKKLISQFVGQATGRATLDDRGRMWGELVTKSLPNMMVGDLAERIRKAFVKRFLARTGAGTLGRLIPFGVGAVIGGAGNRILAGKVIDAAQEAFGPAPAMFPIDLRIESRQKGESRGFVFFNPRLLVAGKGRKGDEGEQAERELR